jgi:quercetin dioxygenase-like cupin family protein
MKLTHPQYSHKDDRGEITDILVKEGIDFVTIITSLKGAVRGQHYHKETVQYVYILKGKMKLLARLPDQPTTVTILEKGDLAFTDVMEEHAMIALEDSAFMVFTRGTRGGVDYEKDTYRLHELLQEPPQQSLNSD